MKQLIWLSFDLGVRGDYQGMYDFLDRNEAKECGDSVGVFWYEYKQDLVRELTKAIKAAVSIGRRSRVYIVYVGENGATKGTFIIGGRKSPPWAGYAPSQGHEEDVSG